jgi:hypothetical protein
MRGEQDGRNTKKFKRKMDKIGKKTRIIFLKSIR